MTVRTSRQPGKGRFEQQRDRQADADDHGDRDDGKDGGDAERCPKVGIRQEIHVVPEPDRGKGTRSAKVVAVHADP